MFFSHLSFKMLQMFQQSACTQQVFGESIIPFLQAMNMENEAIDERQETEDGVLIYIAKPIWEAIEEATQAIPNAFFVFRKQ